MTINQRTIVTNKILPKVFYVYLFNGESLGEILKQIKPTSVFIYDKSVPNSENKRLRPDYRCEDLKLIIEFDGESHYCKASRILTHIKKVLPKSLYYLVESN